MCYGHVDTKVLEREVADRLRAAQASEASDAPAPAKRPVFTGALARLRAMFAGRGVAASE